VSWALGEGIAAQITQTTARTAEPAALAHGITPPTRPEPGSGNTRAAMNKMSDPNMNTVLTKT